MERLSSHYPRPSKQKHTFIYHFETPLISSQNTLPFAGKYPGIKRSSAGWKGQVTLLQDEILFKMLPQMNVRLPGVGPEFISDLQAPFWVAQIAKDLPAVQETWVQSLGWEGPWLRAWQPIPAFLSGKFHGQRNLVGYSPWGHKESDTPKQLSNSTSSNTC